MCWDLTLNQPSWQDYGKAMADRRRHLPSLCCACAVDLCRLAGPSVLSTYAFACKRGGGWVASLSGVTGTALVAALFHVSLDKL